MQEYSGSTASAGAVLTVDLGALRENYRKLAALAGGVDRCAGVVKADAYGLGAAEVGPALMTEGCSTFLVAHVGEGISLRAALGPSPRIFILNGIPPGAEVDAISHDLIPVINSLEQLAAWRQAAQRTGKQLSAAVQVDSGMARLGMPPAEVERIGADDTSFEGIDVVLVMSHLACADEPDNKANLEQQQSFELLRTMLPEAPVSLANSAGIFLGPDFHYDLVRPGIALYGSNPVPGQKNPMRRVVGLQAKVIQTRQVAAGGGVGYGHAFRAARPMATATISLGYADGWPRRAGAAGFYKSVRLPFAGRVSMDSIVLDISALPSDVLHAGDMVDLIADDQSVDDIAALAGTIGYEILTSLGHRFHRRYLGT